MMPAEFMTRAVSMLPNTVSQLAHLGHQLFTRHAVKISVHIIHCCDELSSMPYVQAKRRAEGTSA